MSQENILERVVEAHHQRVFSASFDPHGEFLLTQSFDGTAKLWSLPSFDLVLKWPGADSAVSFSADGRRLGPWVNGRTVQLLELARREAFRVLPASPRRGDCVGAFSPDGRWVVVPGSNGVECFDLRTSQRVWVEPLAGARHVSFRPDGGQMLVLDEGNAREWPWLADSEAKVPRLGAPRFTRDGRRRTGDLLIKTRFRGEEAAFLIHLEHEAQAHRDFAKRMLEYVALDWRDFVRTDPKYLRPAEVDILLGDASKARRELGWKPHVTFRELAKLMVEADLESAGNSTPTVRGSRPPSRRSVA